MQRKLDSSEVDVIDRVCDAIRNEPIPEYDCSRLSLTECFISNQMTEDSNSVRLYPTLSKTRMAGRTLLNAVVVVSFVLLSAIAINWLGTTSAFAQVQAAVAKTKSMRCKILSFHENDDPFIVSVTMVPGVGSRSDSSGGSETIMNLREGKALEIDHVNRKATKSTLYANSDGYSLAERFYYVVRDVPLGRTKSLGQATWNGKTVDKFEFNMDGTYIALVDPDTKLPVRLELDLPAGLPNGKRFREVVTDFVFDSSVDETVFLLKIPKDYTLVERKESMSPKVIDLATLTVSASHGIGGVPFGANRDEIVAKLGTPDGIEEFSLPLQNTPLPDPKAKDFGSIASMESSGKSDSKVLKTVRLLYSSKGFELDLTDGRGLSEIRCYGRARMGLLARDFQGMTEDELRLGSTVSDVVKALGSPDVQFKSRDEVLHYFHKGYSFVFEDSKLVEVSVKKPEDSNIEINDLGNGSFTKSIKATK